MKLTLCIDRQPRNNSSSEIREYSINIGCPLRSCEDVYDELKIITDDEKKLVGTIIRRCEVDKYGVLKKLENEKTQELALPEITLFEGDNYIYIKEFTDLNMKIQYLTNAEMNKYFATKMELNSKIQQTMDSILLEVSRKADNEQVSAMVQLLADEIALKVQSDEIITSLNAAIKDGKGIISILGNYLVIDTDNFKLNDKSILECQKAILNNVTIREGDILLSGTEGRPSFQVQIPNKRGFVSISGDSILCGGNNGEQAFSYSLLENTFQDGYYGGYLYVGNNSTADSVIIYNGIVSAGKHVSAQQMYAHEYNNNSLITKKKNIEFFSDGLELIENSNFYLFNYKQESDNSRKHIGLVIGDEYKTPEQFMNHKKDSIDLYSLISACGDAIKTLNNKIKILEEKNLKLEEKIFKLERRCNNE